MLPRWKKLSTEIVLENPWWRYRKDQFSLEDGARGEYHYASTYGSVFVIPVTEQGELLLVEQYRYLLDKTSLEFPGGGIGEHEPPLTAARRELEEETGYTSELSALGTFVPWNGVSDETCHLFLAEQLREADGSAQPDATERFIVHRYSPAAFDTLIASGQVWDGMTLAAYALYRATRAASAL